MSGEVPTTTIGDKAVVPVTIVNEHLIHKKFDYGQIASTLSIMGGFMALIIKAGVWIADLRTDITRETDSRRAEEKALIQELKLIEEDHKRIGAWLNIPQPERNPFMGDKSHGP
jgi:hypothetical protein